MPLDGVRKDEGEVALDGLVAGEIVGGDFFEREFVELREVELGEVDGLAEFAGFLLFVGEFAEVGDGVVVYEGGGRAAGLEPGWGFCGECDRVCYGWRNSRFLHSGGKVRRLRSK